MQQATTDAYSFIDGLNKIDFILETAVGHVEVRAHRGAGQGNSLE
jgi:hypothetical protein